MSFSAETFQKYYEKLAVCAKNAEKIADGLYFQGVIDRRCVRRIREKLNQRSSYWLAKELFLATQEVLNANPSKFTSVIKALRCDSSLDSLCNEMEQTKGMQTLYYNIISSCL